MKAVYAITGINPEPWVSPEGTIARTKGKMHIRFYKSAGLESYQQAVVEELRLQNGHVPPEPADEPVQVTFWLWRELDQSDAKDQTRSEADATNMQKALEDALQGILYKNDKKNRDVRTIVVEQGRETLPNIQIEIRTGADINSPPPPLPMTPGQFMYDPFPKLPTPDGEMF